MKKHERLFSYNLSISFDNRKIKFNSLQFFHLFQIFNYSFIQFIQCYIFHYSIFIWFLEKKEKMQSRLIDKSIPRVIFIGDSGVGKTSIIVRVTTGVFDASPAPTIGAGVRPISINVNETQVKFHIWDTAGQEIYRSIVPLYFKQAICAIVVFSFSDQRSFDSVPEWIDLLKSQADHPVPVVIVGNKFDIPERAVEVNVVKKFCTDNKYPFFFTSAVTGEQIQQLFEYVAENYVAHAQALEEAKLASSEEPKNCC
ncbi:Vacuolar protein sorting-associated protein 21 [Tritrichomonas foetus]|uniref:Vacuolar protein sorting-associated protein 21 n=1 Tax=Tritrichomonas foetus TaxID=1144522 RepID=A0A1J4JMJ7_9EUKA|nr:Vacuolar protein sorting-associated protein 21 [Tritrichomonas foetus]|eukprot:OHS99921.1 Vacuolar protein sorting-associated protein 21 [Tritrichomonas foetus]